VIDGGAQQLHVFVEQRSLAEAAGCRERGGRGESAVGVGDSPGDLLVATEQEHRAAEDVNAERDPPVQWS